MSRSATWLLGLLGLLVLCVACVALHSSRIETMLAERAQSALVLAGLSETVTVSMSGRDATIQSELANDASVALETVRGIRGIRRVSLSGPGMPLPEIDLDGPFALTPLAGGTLALRGVVPDETIRTELLTAAREAFPGIQVRDGLDIDSTASGDWAADMAAAMPRMKAVDSPGLAVAADGAFVLMGTVDGEGTRRNVETRVAEVVTPREVRNQIKLVGANVPITRPTPRPDTARAPRTTPRDSTTRPATPRAQAPRRADSLTTTRRPTPQPAPTPRSAGQVEVQNALPSDADAKALERALRQTLGRGTVTFESGSDRLTPGSREVLARAAAALKANPEIAIELQAHTDSEGPAGPNQKLSEARARAAKRALVEAGAAAEQLLAAGYGESTAIADNDTEAGRAKNRRVVFKLLRRR